MNPLSEDMKNYLIDQGVGSGTPTNEWSIHIASMPPSPDEVIVIRDTGGMQPTYLMDETTVNEPTVRVETRAQSYLSGYSKCEEAVNALCLSKDLVIDGTDYWSIMQVSPIGEVGQDDKRRIRLATTLKATR